MCLKSRAVYICFTLPPRGLIVWSGVDWVERQMRRRLSPWGQNQSGFPILGKALRRPFHLNSQQLGLLKHQLSLVRYIVLPGDVTGRLCRTPASSLAVCYHPALARIPTRLPGRERQNFFRHPSDACFISVPRPGMLPRRGWGGGSCHGSGCGVDRFGVRVVSSRSDRGVIMPSHSPTPPPLTLGFCFTLFIRRLVLGAECKPPSFSLVEPCLGENIVGAIRPGRKSPRLRAFP